jgi:hypothetical protein
MSIKTLLLLYISHIQLKKLKYVVDRRILAKLEIALGQQKSALLGVAISHTT